MTERWENLAARASRAGLVLFCPWDHNAFEITDLREEPKIEYLRALSRRGFQPAALFAVTATGFEMELATWLRLWNQYDAAGLLLAAKYRFMDGGIVH